MNILLQSLPSWPHAVLSLLALPPLHPTLVELQLLALQDVAVAAAALSRPRGDACQQPSSRELVIHLHDTILEEILNLEQ